MKRKQDIVLWHMFLSLHTARFFNRFISYIPYFTNFIFIMQLFNIQLYAQSFFQKTAICCKVKLLTQNEGLLNGLNRTIQLESDSLFFLWTFFVKKKIIFQLIRSQSFFAILHS